MSDRRDFTRADALALLAGSASSALGFGLTTPAARGATAIRVGSGLADSYGTPYYGVDGGRFQAAGLDIDLTTLANGAAIVQACAGNAIDVGLGDPIQVANAINAGVPMAYFAGCGLYSTDAPTTLLCVKPGSPIRNARELEGKNVAVVSLASISSLGVSELLRRNGADVAKVHVVEMPFSAMPAALERDRVDAAFIAEPFLSANRDTLQVLAKAFDAIAPSFYISAWFASRKWLSENAAAAKQLTKAAYDVARWANANHAQTAAILAKEAKLPIERVQAMTRVRFATSLDAGRIQPLLDIAYRYKHLTKPVVATEIMVELG